MDDPGLSVFQGAKLQINNSNNIEEEEDLEDQLRRKHELENLLQNNLDDFKYDDSTMNSSVNVSLASVDNLERVYKDATSADEQLKVLYEIRCRELQTLKEQFDHFKEDATAQIERQKREKLLMEAEMRQLQISLKNAENLLVDKAEKISLLESDLITKTRKITELDDRWKNMEFEITAYKSDIAELHLKLQSQKFNADAKHNVEQLKGSLEAKIVHLQTMLDDQQMKIHTHCTEKQALQDELERLVKDKISLEKDNKSILDSLDGAQQQCKDLIDIIDLLKKENEHFKSRYYEVNDGKFIGQLSNEPNDKLRKVFVDKSVELDTLKAKLKNYENDIRELQEYQKIKSDLLRKDFNTCENKNHIKDLLVMQIELKNCRRQIQEKSQQIDTLTLNNKDLKEKIEEMLLQTRNDIQNISTKYNLPQLEMMKKELEKAEMNERILTEKLQESEERRLNLVRTLEANANIDSKSFEELKQCKRELISTKNKLIEEQERCTSITNQLEFHQNELTQVLLQLDELKQHQTNIDSNLPPVLMEQLESPAILEIHDKMDVFLKTIQSGNVEKGVIEEQINSWKKDLEQMNHLSNLFDISHVTKSKTEENIRDIATIGNAEMDNLKLKITELEDQLKTANSLESQIEQLKEVLRSRDDYINTSNERMDNFEKENNNLKDKLIKQEAAFETASNDLKRIKAESKQLLKEIDRLQTTNEKLKQTTHNKSENIQIENELKIRDELQIEYQKRIHEIEKRYQKLFKETTDLCKRQKVELGEQDQTFRDYLKVVLTECEFATVTAEDEKKDLQRQLEVLQLDLDRCKKERANETEKFKTVLSKFEKRCQENQNAWKCYARKVISSSLKIEATNRKFRDRIVANLDRCDQEVNTLRKTAYNN